MNPSSLHSGGDRLFASLPEIYRNYDRSSTRGAVGGDLREYLDAFGEVLDLLRDVLEQKVADAVPNLTPGARAPQGWVLHYLAQVVGADLVSVDDAGRRLEIARTIHWRKRKGTLTCAEDIVARLGAFGWSDGDPARRPYRAFVVQEGLKRIATTPRVESVTRPTPSASRASADARLVATTVDFRVRSRFVKTDAGVILAANPHGVPCFPGTSEDMTRRTPDLRAASWSTGHVHPQRLAVFVALEAGFFPPGWEKGVPGAQIAAPAQYALATAERHAIDKVVFDNPTTPLTVTEGVLTLSTSVVLGDVVLDAGDAAHALSDVIVNGTLHVRGGRASLARVAARAVVVEATAATDALTVEDSLLGSLNTSGDVKLTAVTVIADVTARACHATDSVFAGDIHLTESKGNCFRYSRVPTALFKALTGRQVFSCFDDTPRFLPAPPRKGMVALPDIGTSRAAYFGEEGAGVLHRAGGAQLYSGAEDSGEVGAYHHRRSAPRARAMRDKVDDHLPLGQEAVLIPDPKLACAPPRAK